MQVIISPAKQMQVAADGFLPQGIPPFPERTERLWRALLDLEQAERAAALQKLWKVNDKLLAENLERLHAYRPIMCAGDLADPELSRLAAPAIFSYVGIQYRSMAPAVLDGAALDWLQHHLWVLSGWYGCVRPFDAVEPYRLEMGARLSVDGARDLYIFWGDALARQICSAEGEEPTVVNLASVEYAKAVLPHLSAGATVATCLFGEELRGSKPVQRATASKIARGSMARWLAERGASDLSELEHFNVGYRYAPELSAERIRRDGAHERTLVFLRKE
ncbi:YaaA family protein [Collinsella intestinalis]|uniref:YaaA family protein n=1 Tax=Collinsella intestinalis TaxID=147207 RepID=UPI00195A6DFD|nr:YaaA family protein [Collinsella intestinalis]MBM6683341.1 YaaA family protein [Collinsella intestinalis]